MTPEEFKKRWHPYSVIGEWDETVNALLATVREEARRAALEEAASIPDEWPNTPLCREIAERIRMKIKPPRTLNDVLADIKVLATQSTNVRILGVIAQTAVEGLKVAAQCYGHSDAYDRVNETIRKLLEIK